MLKLELDIGKEEAKEHFSILFEGFGDGTTDWDMEDYLPAWNFLEKLREAVANA